MPAFDGHGVAVEFLDSKPVRVEDEIGRKLA
jgi:hypothetical protein